MSAPWTFEEAHNACRAASLAQRAAEDVLREAVIKAAEAEHNYRVALAKAILRQHHEEGVAWTVAPDLARGDEQVARLRRDRDIAEGMREVAGQIGWRRAADRKDSQRFADFSLRQALAEGHGTNPQPDWGRQSVIGGRRTG